LRSKKYRFFLHPLCEAERVDQRSAVGVSQNSCILDKIHPMPKAAKTPIKKAAKKITAKKVASKKVAVPKKTAPKKSAPDSKETKTIQIKYSDKSAGQPELVVIFDKIKKMMEPYDKKRSLVLHADKPSQAILVSHKPVEIAGRMRNELWFISALVQKGYVGFYYTAYIDDELKKQFSAEFVKSLKGKSCFHITKNTPEIMADIKKAIDQGYKSYVDKGWL
jgi:hypothetical protein